MEKTALSLQAMFPAAVYQAALGGAFTPQALSIDLGTIIFAELVMTMFLTTTVTMGAVNKKTTSPLAPFGIGLTVAANIFLACNHVIKISDVIKRRHIG